MAGCGKPWNGPHKVEGDPLRCGTKLSFKVLGKSDRERATETLLCDECEKENK